MRSKAQSPIASSLFRRAYASGSDIDAADNEHKLVDSAVDAAEIGGGAAPTFAFGNPETEQRNCNEAAALCSKAQANRIAASDIKGFRPRPRNVIPSASIYIGNLLFDVTDTDLAREFGKFGPVKKAVIATDARGLSKGQAASPYSWNSPS